MRFQLLLLLSSVLSSEVLSLVCQYCTSQKSTPCTDFGKEINCPDQCATVTLFKVADGTNSTKVTKTCGVPQLCSAVSVDLGEMSVTINAKCCNTANCNKETLTALPMQRANGKMCYSCKNNDCSHTVDCVGDQDQCISQQGKTMTRKGCADKSTCTNPTLLSAQGILNGSIQCCEGNLCNGSESFTTNFLLMIISLFSSIIFY